MGEFDRRAAKKFRLRVAEHFLKRLIHRKVAPVWSYQGNSDGNTFKQTAPPLFTRPQLGFGLLPIAVFIDQFGVEASILQRYRSLRRQHFQDCDSVWREDVRR